MDFLISICVLCAFLLVGKALRANIKLLQRMFLPSAIIAGFIALAVGPYGLNLIPDWILAQWRPLAGILIRSSVSEWWPAWGSISSPCLSRCWC